MKILKLTASNIKRLSAVEITPDGSPVVTIGGENGAGKSSVLDAIQMALGGAALTPIKPVRSGQKTGKVVIDLGDLTVTRTFTAAGGGSLIVASKDGARYPSPQAMLDKLIGQLSFDPLAFGQMKPKEQRETLRALVGLDTSDLDKAIDYVYTERATVNRSVKQLEGQFAALPFYPDAPGEEVSIVALTQELAQAEATQAALQAARSGYEKAAREQKAALDVLERQREAVAALRAQLEAAERSLATAEDNAIATVETVKRAEYAGKQAKAALIESAPIRERIAEADALNVKVRANLARAKAEAHIDREKSAAEGHTLALQQLERDKAERIAVASFPVPGLGISDDGVTLNGEPFEQASQAERIRVSVAMGLALNPTLKVLLVRDGSLLDRKGLALLAELAAAAEAQVWVERVTESADGVSVFIEDGTVKAAEAVA